MSRRTGRTTRVIDKAIQQLFQSKIVRFAGANINVYDHIWEEDVPESTKKHSQRDAFSRMLERLHNEHPHEKFIIDEKTLTIRLG